MIDEAAIAEAFGFANGALQGMKDAEVKAGNYDDAAFLRDLLGNVLAEVHRLCEEHREKK